MVQNSSPFISMSYDDTAQLDSTKRCLFPVEDELSPSGLRSTKLSLRKIDSVEKTRVENEENLALDFHKESLNSPISVVCVLNSGYPTVNSKSYDNGHAQPSSSSSLLQTKEILSCDDVEEQTMIEVQYIEAGHQVRDFNAIPNFHTETKINENT